MTMKTPVKNDSRNIAGLEITKVVREFIPIIAGDSSIGEIIDAYIIEAAKTGIEVQEIKFMIEREQWFELAEKIQQANRAEYQSYESTQV